MQRLGGTLPYMSSLSKTLNPSRTPNILAIGMAKLEPLEQSEWATAGDFSITRHGRTEIVPYAWLTLLLVLDADALTAADDLDASAAAAARKTARLEGGGVDRIVKPSGRRLSSSKSTGWTDEQLRHSSVEDETTPSSGSHRHSSVSDARAHHQAARLDREELRGGGALADRAALARAPRHPHLTHGTPAHAARAHRAQPRDQVD